MDRPAPAGSPNPLLAPGWRKNPRLQLGLTVALVYRNVPFAQTIAPSDGISKRVPCPLGTPPSRLPEVLLVNPLVWGVPNGSTELAEVLLGGVFALQWGKPEQVRDSRPVLPLRFGIRQQYLRIGCLPWLAGAGKIWYLCAAGVAALVLARETLCSHLLLKTSASF